MSSKNKSSICFDPTVCSALRVLVLMMTIIPFPYWRLFCINIIIFIYLIVELIIRPWRMSSVQIFSIASLFLLLFATGILFRPAGRKRVLCALGLHFCLKITFVFSSSDLYFAALQANLFTGDLDNFRSNQFAAFMFIVILVVLPIGIGLFLLSKNKNYFDN
jgi:hypothetical protein